MRILHTSDWHIGRQFHNQSLLDDQREVLAQIVTIAAEQQVDAVLIAGDVFDRSVPPAAAVELLDEVLDQLCNELQLPVILISGNHDSAERLAFGRRQMAGGGLHIFASLDQLTQPVKLTVGEQSLVFYGIPYADPARVRDYFGIEASTHDEAMAFLSSQVQQYHQQSEDQALPAVVLSHCFIAGGEASESERPLSIGGADQVGYQHFLPFAYAALGHLHGRQFKGQQHIRYSGSILKYSFSEQHQQKSVVIADIDSAAHCQIEQIPLNAPRDMRVLEGSLEDLLAQGVSDQANEDYLLIRLTDKHAIMDAMGKLRAVYPNVLHLERPGLMAIGSAAVARKDLLKKSEMAMFEDFFQQVKGEAISTEQKKVLETLLDDLHQRGNS